ncbi:hypothetical protein WMY93_018735 [Mugilogobius chulae]|uniref:LAA1-like C-terminal TPR repeats domain-containing protein n=1 Tax=Mugilogobius chulae TaxID=88201 RepID=A0AAW0NWJ0_9GOBI
MELAHSLLLNEEALAQITEAKRPVFIFEWLRFLDKVLVAANKVDVKEKQKKLVEQLTGLISSAPGPPTRKLLAKNLATLYSIGDTFTVFQTLDKCNEIIKSKDDTPAYLPTKLAAVACVGAFYEKMGRMLGSSFPDTINNLLKALKSAESQGRGEILLSLQKVLSGLGGAAASCHRDIYKNARSLLTDRSMAVRCAVAKCLLELQNEAVFMWTTELESLATLCFKALEGSNYGVRVAVAKLLGTVMATALMPKQAAGLCCLCYYTGGSVAGAKLCHIPVPCVGPGLHPRATQTHVEAVYSRRCVSFMLRATLGGLLGEKAQIAAGKEICQAISKQMRAVEAVVNDLTGENKAGAADVSASQHVMVCALKELGSLVQSLSATASPLIQEPSIGLLETVSSVLLHPSMAARLAAAWCLRCVAVALPYQLTPLLDRCAERINNLKSSPEAVSGYSFAMAALLGGVHQCPLGIPHSKGKLVVSIAEDLLRSAAQNSRLSLQRTQAGWLLLGALMTLDAALWRNVFPRSQKELEAEKARGDSFTWQVTLEGRAGALCAMRSFVAHCPELLTEDVIRRLMTPIECAMTMMSHVPSIIKVHGAHLKASAAMVRLRLYDILALLPPKTYEGSFNALLRELVAEFTLTDNSANTTTSLLRSLCHYDDSVLMGSWLQETDHKSIEDQLQPNSASGSGALEHDPSSIYLRVPVGEAIPGPLPLGVSVIDASVALFGVVFPHVSFKHSLALVMGALDNPNPILRCAAGEALGRMAQVVGEATFIARMAQTSFDKLKSARDVVSRTGHSLALGCLHRYVGGIGSGQHLKTSVSILLALAQDGSSHEVQTWALHSLALIVDSSGPMYRGYVEPTLSLVLTLLLTVPPSHTEVHQCLGRCLGALITTVGPELQGNGATISTIRSSCLVGCAIMQDHSDSLVQAAAISVCSSFTCLLHDTSTCPVWCPVSVSEHHRDGSGGSFVGMLDRETDRKLCSDIHDTLGHMLSSLAVEKLSHWLKLCKDVLAATTDVGGPVVFEVERDEEDSEKNNETDDDTMFTGLGDDDKSKPSVAPRWVTRVFAADCLCRIILLCENADKAHFDLAAARAAKKGDLLVRHLSDLIRMAFMAATDHSNQLRMAGLQALEDIIKKFASVPEPEFPGHVILEQYQANVGAALRPAFSPDTPSDITAKACQVCSTWIGSGVVSDLNDLRRVHNLLVSSLDKVQTGKGSSSQLYSESATTMEKLAVLKAWAEVYVMAMKIKKEAESKPAKPVKSGDEDEDEEDLSADVLPPDSLITLVQPELPSLSRLWLAMLRDYALLTLPAEFSSQLPPEGGAFYTPETIDTARLHYRSSWAPVLHAVALWLNSTGFGAGEDKSDSPSAPSKAAGVTQSKTFEETVKDRMHLILGVSIEFLCFPRPEEPIEHVMSCLQALCTLFDSPCAKMHIAEDQLLAVELLNVLHRLLLTRDPPAVQLQVTAVVQETIRAAQDQLLRQRTSKNKDEEVEKESVPGLGEGGDTGELVPGKSLVFACMELLVFILVRHLPQLNTKVKESPSHAALRPQRLSEESARLVAHTVSILAELPSLCTPAGSMTILPTVLFLITGVLKETALKTADNSVPAPVSAALQAIKTIITSPLAREESIKTQWTTLVRSSLASVIEYSQPDDSRPDMDDISMLTAITLFLLSAGGELVGVTVLQKGSMDRYRNALNSGDPWMEARCYQLLLSVFQHCSRALSTPYIHALAPILVEKLKAVETNRPKTQVELQAIQEGVRVLETLVGMGEEQNRVQLLALLVPTLISYLLDEKAISSASPVSKGLHEFALQNLMRIGPLYPAAFKIVIGAAPELKTRLESAIRANQASSKAKAAARQAQPTVQAAPTIKLKTSFF